jgi:hypothetical protein
MLDAVACANFPDLSPAGPCWTTFQTDPRSRHAFAVAPVTTAVAMGDALIERLTKAGITFRVLDGD